MLCTSGVQGVRVGADAYGSGGGSGSEVCVLLGRKRGGQGRVCVRWVSVGERGEARVPACLRCLCA